MKNVTKILSILCLVGILACAFVPCITLSGGYMELLNGLTGAAAGIPEESYEVIEQMLETQGVTFDLRACVDSIANLATPLADGEVSIMDFYELSQNTKTVAEMLGKLPMDGFSVLGEELDSIVQEMGAMVPGMDSAAQGIDAINQMVTTLAQLGQTMRLISIVFLIPVGLFAVLAFFVVLRIIFRILGRRGLGVGITLLTILNAALMIGIPYGINYAVGEGFPISAEYTNVPFIMVGCAIVNCIIWAIGRGAKVKKVKEVPVETPVAPVTPATPITPEASVEPVAEAPVEVEVSVDDIVVDETVEDAIEDVAEETEEVEDETV